MGHQVCIVEKFAAEQALTVLTTGEMPILLPINVFMFLLHGALVVFSFIFSEVIFFIVKTILTGLQLVHLILFAFMELLGILPACSSLRFISGACNFYSQSDAYL